MTIRNGFKKINSLPKGMTYEDGVLTIMPGHNRNSGLIMSNLLKIDSQDCGTGGNLCLLHEGKTIASPYGTVYIDIHFYTDTLEYTIYRDDFEVEYYIMHEQENTTGVIDVRANFSDPEETDMQLGRQSILPLFRHNNVKLKTEEHKLYLVTTIGGEYGFHEIRNLKYIVIPEGVVTILPHAFEILPSVKMIIFPSTISEIHNSNFLGFPSLKLCDMRNVKHINFVDCCSEDGEDWWGDLFYGCDPKGKILMTNELYQYIKTNQPCAIQEDWETGEKLLGDAIHIEVVE